MTDHAEVMMENRWVLRAKAAKLFRRMDEDNSGSLTTLRSEGLSLETASVYNTCCI